VEEEEEVVMDHETNYGRGVLDGFANICV
jgi:hypothetical protein